MEQNVAQKIKLALPLVDYVRAHAADLKPGTRIEETSRGLRVNCQNPAHNDRNPSMDVSELENRFHCWSCGFSGDLLTLVQVQRDVDFSEALRDLAREAGIDYSAARDDSPQARLRALMRTAARFYAQRYRELPEDHPARLAVTERGLSDVRPGEESEGGSWYPDFSASADGVVYGYAPGGNRLMSYLLKARPWKDAPLFTLDELRAAGVVSHRKDADPDDRGAHFDTFRDRLVFTITDVHGHPLAFSARKLSDKDNMGKYVNTRETELFSKRHELYWSARGLREAQKVGHVFVCEGQFDVSAAVEAGVTNVVASLGTSFTGDHAMLVRRAAGDECQVVFVFDGDDAGRGAAVKAFERVEQVRADGRVILCPDGVDPCDVLASGGVDAARSLFDVGKSVPLAVFVASEKIKEFDLSDAGQRMRAARVAASVLAQCPGVARDVLAADVAALVGVGAESMRELADERTAFVDGLVSGSTVESVPVPQVSARIDGGSDADCEWVRRWHGESVGVQLLVQAFAGLFYAPPSKGDYGDEGGATVGALVAERVELLRRLAGESSTPAPFARLLGGFRALWGRERVLLDDFGECADVMGVVLGLCEVPAPGVGELTDADYVRVSVVALREYFRLLDAGVGRD